MAQMMRRVAARTSFRLRSMRRFSSPSPAQRDGVDVFIGRTSEKAQIRLPRVAFGVAADQPAPTQ